MQRELTGRTALVTGGSRGIGRAIALALAGAGARLAVGYAHDRHAAERVAAEIADAGGEGVLLGGDLADPASVRAVADAAIRELGAVDILVANAGIGPQTQLADVTPEDWDRVQAVNLRAPFLLTQALVPGMRERGYGRIVLMSSVAAFTGGIVGPHYAASKAGLLGLAHYLARTLAGDGITVNAIAPALVATDMLPADPESQRRFAEMIPVGRMGMPEEVADLVLAVVANGYVTGQTLSVDGGAHPR
jgi:3-oxoacyl-[acyl-carrier protein] reductase